MKKILALFAVLTASFCLSIPAFAATPDANLDINKFVIQWQDEFDGTALNESYWTPQIGNGNNYGVWEWGNNEKEYYKKDNISVSDGTLKINAKYEQNAGKVGQTTYNFSSARFTSSGKVNIGLGYVEARIKMPSAKGIWPAFWMLGTNGKTWPACGEIDIMEAFNTRNTLQSTIHYNNWKGEDVYVYAQRGDLDKTEWHTFGCYRDGENCAFYIDGKRLINYTTADIPEGKGYAGQRSVLNDDYYLLLNVACGGNLAGGMPENTLDVNMEVDYVRYYRAKTPEELEAEKKEETTQTATQTQAPPQSVQKKVTKPGKAKLNKAVNVKKRRIKLSLKKIKNAKGYQIRWCDNKKFQGFGQKNITKLKYTIRGLYKGKWYIKVRAYTKSGSKKIYGKWSAVKKVRVRK